jgi:hypothetical protein
MYPAESVHTYPRLLTGAIEWLCALLVAITSVRIGVIFLRALWGIYGRNNERVAQIPLLPDLIRWIDGVGLGRGALADLWPALIAALVWAALALFATVVLRNAFPAVRTSAQGMLVEFSGSWLPVPWEGLRMIRVTSDLAGERFVLLVQTSRGQLTVWHRLYSLVYGPRWSAGFYITSNIREFDLLVQTMLSESERTARASETARPVRLNEDTPSPLFRLLLSPGAFFSRSAAADAAAASMPQAPIRPGGPVSAAYPPRITALLNAAVLLLVVLAGLRYLSHWSSFVALAIPAARDLAPFSWSFSDPRYLELYNAFRSRGVPFLGIPGRPDLPAPWWLLVSAHLSVLLVVAAVIWLRNLLPAIESRADGLAVRDAWRRRWLLLPWERVRALKLTELSEQSQIVLLQGRGLPGGQGLTSMLYDGSAGPGVLITSAISNFQPMLQHALGQIMAREPAGGQPVLRQEARSPLIWMAFGGRTARDAMVADARDDAATRVVSVGRLAGAARTMAAVALPPALLVLLGGLLSDRVPSLGLGAAALALWVFGMLEWPLVGLISVLLDDNTGGGEEGYRALYLYPTSQLPRLLPLVAAVVLQIVGVPLLPALAWLGAIAWAFWLGMSLWESLYQWTGSQAILGGLLPVFWQLLLLVGYLVAVR